MSTTDNNNAVWNALTRNGDVALAMGTFALLAIILVPLPPLALDVLLASSVSLALLLFVATTYVNKPVDFSAFPILLLVTTIL